MQSPRPFSLSQLLTLAWPIVIARATQSVVGLADALMSAPLGEQTLAAVTTGAMNYFFFSVFPMGIVFLAQSFSSQLRENDLPAAVRYGWYALVVAALTGVLGLAANPTVTPLLTLLGYDPGVSSEMAGYLETRMWSIGFNIGTEALGGWYGGLGNTQIHMVSGIVSMTINVFLNWIFIEGNLGAPQLGAVGAGLASSIASFAGFAVVAVPFFRGWSIKTPSVAPRGLALSEFRRLLRFGSANGVNWFMEVAAFTMFINVMMGGLGTTTLSAVMVVFNLNSVAFMPGIALATSGAILSGQAIGDGRKNDVRGIVWLTIRTAAVWQGSLGILYLTLPRLILRGFAGPESHDNGWIALATLLLGISALWQLFDAVGLTIGEALRAAGDTAWVMWARLIVAWVIFIPSAYYATSVRGWGAPGGFACVVLYLGILSATLAARLWTGGWRRINLTGNPEAKLLD